MARYSTVVEVDAEKLLVEGIRKRGGLCLKLKFIGIDGAPDRLVITRDGRLILVELKKIGGKLEHSQEVMFEALRIRRVDVHVLEGCAAVARFLVALDNGQV